MPRYHPQPASTRAGRTEEATTSGSPLSVPRATSNRCASRCPVAGEEKVARLVVGASELGQQPSSAPRARRVRPGTGPGVGARCPDQEEEVAPIGQELGPEVGSSRPVTGRCCRDGARLAPARGHRVEPRRSGRPSRRGSCPSPLQSPPRPPSPAARRSSGRRRRPGRPGAARRPRRTPATGHPGTRKEGTPFSVPGSSRLATESSGRTQIAARPRVDVGREGDPTTVGRDGRRAPGRDGPIVGQVDQEVRGGPWLRDLCRARETARYPARPAVGAHAAQRPPLAADGARTSGGDARAPGGLGRLGRARSDFLQLQARGADVGQPRARVLAQAAREQPPHRRRRRRRQRVAGPAPRVITCAMTSVTVSPANSDRPVSISHSSTPKDHTSARLSTGLPRACSGDM